MQCACGFDCGKGVGHVSKAHNVFGMPCHVNDDVKATTTNMVQSQIREVNQNFGNANRGRN